MQSLRMRKQKTIELSRQTSAKQTNAQTQRNRTNRSVSIADRRSPHKKQKAVETTTKTTPKTTRWKQKPPLGPVSRKPRKLSRPVKPFLVDLYLKTKKCIRLKLLVWREPLFILTIMWLKQLCNHKIRDFAMALRARKVFGAFEKLPPRSSRERLTGLVKKITVYTEKF